MPDRETGGEVRRPVWLLPRVTAVVLVLGAIVTGVLTFASEASYSRNERHLTTLQTNLTASALGIAQVDLERRLGQALALASEASNPGATFKQAVAPSMAPKGSFARAALRLVTAKSVETLVEVGTKSITNPNSSATFQLYQRAAKSSSLVTSRIVGEGEQRLSYLLSAPSSRGTLVAAASQSLPSNRRISIPASSPDADLNIAIYFGTTTTPASLLESNVSDLPLRGTVATAEVPFGSSVLTLVASPNGSLAGTWAEFIPWGILAVGIAFTLGIAAMTGRLDLRRRRAEELTDQVTDLYRVQRSNSETLQRGLLPKQLPSIAGVGIAGRYLPGDDGLEVGGDWYSAIAVDAHRFVIVVGDVSGHGIPAATLMASLRYTARSFASIGYEPAAILETAGREIDLSADNHFATALVGTIDMERREITLASAGHLPPLLVADGEARFLNVPVGQPLGLGQTTYGQTTFPISPRSTLIAYTDGLVERRDAAIDVGLEALRVAALDASGPVETVLDDLVGRLVSAGREDDIVLLGVQWLE